MGVKVGDAVLIDGKHKAQVLSIDYQNGEAFVKFDDQTSTTSSPWVRLDRLSAVTLPIGNQVQLTVNGCSGFYAESASSLLKCPVITAHTRKCECDSHKAGSDRHSDYCPLYTK